jgi:hypothetical protein
MRRLCSLISGMVLLLLVQSGHAAFDALRIVDDVSSPRIDGVLDEAVWQQAPAKADFFTWSPRDGGQVPVSSSVQIAYDSKYFYVALRAKDPDKSRISAPWVRRDLVGFEQDYFDVYIDPVGSGRFAQVFRISPRGILTDGVFNEATGEIDFAPDFAFDGAASTTDDGWIAELRIPFSELRYPARGTNWTMLVVRNYTRGQRWRLSTAPLQWGDNCTLCKREPVTHLEDVPSGWQTSLVVNGISRSSSTTSAVGRIDERKLTGGVDFKIRPTASVVVDGTINPDFSQIELDNPQLGSNKLFALYFEEHRPFFVEGSDLLSMKTDGKHDPRLPVYTRSITDPLWGLRATTRGEQLETLWLSALDQGGGTILLPGPYQTSYLPQPTSTVNVARTRYALGNLELGGFLTHRDYKGFGQNTVAGPELTVNGLAVGRVYLRWLESYTSAIEVSEGVLGRGQSERGRSRRFQLEHYGEDFDMVGWYEDATPKFRADTGFFSQTGFRSMVAELTWRQGARWKLNEVNLIGAASRTVDWDGRIIEASSGIGAYIAGPRDTEAKLTLYPNHLQRVSAAGRLHARRHVVLEVSSLPGRLVSSISAQLDVGQQLDIANDRVTAGSTLGLGIKARPLERLELDMQVQRQILSEAGSSAGNDPTLKDTTFQVLAIYHIGTQDFLRLNLINGSTSRNVSSYVDPQDVAALDSTRTRALTYAHKFDLRSSLYFGYTSRRLRSTESNANSTERGVYAKVSWQF